MTSGVIRFRRCLVEASRSPPLEVVASISTTVRALYRVFETAVARMSQLQSIPSTPRYASMPYLTRIVVGPPAILHFSYVRAQSLESPLAEALSPVLCSRLRW